MTGFLNGLSVLLGLPLILITGIRLASLKVPSCVKLGCFHSCRAKFHSKPVKPCKQQFRIKILDDWLRALGCPCKWLKLGIDKLFIHSSSMCMEHVYPMHRGCHSSVHCCPPRPGLSRGDPRTRGRRGPGSPSVPSYSRGSARKVRQRWWPLSRSGSARRSVLMARAALHLSEIVSLRRIKVLQHMNGLNSL